MQKLLLLLLLLLALLPVAHAQIGFNSPAGLTPTRDVEFYSRDVFMVQQKYVRSTDPVSGTFAISCAASPPALTAIAGVLLDPSGLGNYLSNLNCAQAIISPDLSLSLGYELTFTQLDTEANGDSVFVGDFFGGRVAFSGNVLPAVLLVPAPGFFVSFKSDNDGNVGAGFVLSFRRVSVTSSSRGLGDGSFGKTFQFDLEKGSLVGGLNGMEALRRAGNYSTGLGYRSIATGLAASALGYQNSAIGVGASALGYQNSASGARASALGGSNGAFGNYASVLGGNNTVRGDYASALGGVNTVDGIFSSALGGSNTVNGNYASALGGSNVAGGNYASALGGNNTASGDYAVALGGNNRASGPNSLALGTSNVVSNTNAVAMGRSNFITGRDAIALGYNNDVSGNFSTAMGTRMNTNGGSGAFMIGDTDPLNQGATFSTSADRFTARFRNGYYLMTSGSTNPTGVQIGTGGTSWATISDSTRKEHFLPIDGPALLQKISGMKLTTWNYKGQRDRRHYGPMAQEFYALFGHDALGDIGCDTLITTQDMEGLTLSAVQALVKENEQLRAELAAQKAQNVQIQADFSNRLHLIERAMLTRRERVSFRKTKP